MAITPFASKSIVEHLIRGFLGAGALVLAFHVGAAHPLMALAFVAGGIVAFRGCPFCWTAGFIDTVCNCRNGQCDPPNR